MAASSTNSWLPTRLLSPHGVQQQGSSHSLYHASDLPIQMSCSHLSQPQHADVGQGVHRCEPYCQPLHLPLLHQPDQGDFQLSGIGQESIQPSNGLPASSGCVSGGVENGDPASVRKVHKADREKLRRDRLNEQFVELAGVLNPDRPKNDKATILGDGVQAVKELRAEVKRLKCEQSTLFDESRDLAQEKTELREEKAALKTETEQLQNQLQQRLHGMLPWMAMDHSVMMAPTPYPYTVHVPQPVSAVPPVSDTQEPSTAGQMQQSPLAPAPFLSLATPGGFMQPALQAYAVFGSRPPEGGATFLSYPHYPGSMGNHSHVERPYAQYPSPVQPIPGYLMQTQPPPHQGGSMYSTPAYTAPGMPLMLPGQSGSQQIQPRGHPLLPYPQYAGASLQHAYVSHSSSGAPATSPEVQTVETNLQLQMPGGPPSSCAAQHQAQSSALSNRGAGKSKDTSSDSTDLGMKSETDASGQAKPTTGAGDSISALSLSSTSLSPEGPNNALT